MAFATRHTPIVDFVPTVEQRQYQNQHGYPHTVKQQHNSFLSILLDKKEAHGGAVALCSLARSSTAADPLPVSMPPYSSSWASSLLAANRGTFVEVDRCSQPPSYTSVPLCIYFLDLFHISSHASYAPIYMGAHVYKAHTGVYMRTAYVQQIYPNTRALTYSHTYSPPYTALELQKQAADKPLQSFLTQDQQKFRPSLIHQYPTLKYKMTNVLSQASLSFQAQEQQQVRWW